MGHLGGACGLVVDLFLVVGNVVLRLRLRRLCRAGFQNHNIGIAGDDELLGQICLRGGELSFSSKYVKFKILDIQLYFIQANNQTSCK